MSPPDVNDISGGSADSRSDGDLDQGVKPKIEISSDESWKEAAQKEKERLDKETKSSKERELPPASFLTLLESLDLQAMLALGSLAPEDEAPPVDLQAARYVIDTLGVLEEKTKNNLDVGESQALTEGLNRLRMLFVKTSRRVAKEGQKIVTDETLIKDPKDLRGQDLRGQDLRGKTPS